jgi:hypothetical protein
MAVPFSRRLWMGLAAGVVLRALLAPLPGTPDVGTWKTWSFAGSRDVTGLYGVGTIGGTPERGVIRWRDIEGTTEYPPLSLYELAVVGYAYRAIDPAYTDSAILTVLIKVPGLLAEIALVALLLTWGRQEFGDRAAEWAALAVWLNPAVLVNGPALGYLDAQMAMPAAIAFLAVARGRPALAGALAAGAVLTKAQAVFIAPALVLALVRQKRWPAARAGRAFLLGGTAVAVAIVMPFVLRGALANMMFALSQLGAHNMLSGFGANAWWIVTWFVRSSYAVEELGFVEAFTTPVRILQITRFMEVGYPDPKPIGAAIVLGWMAWALWRMRAERTLAAWTYLAAWSVFTYFTFSAQVHENHLYLAVPMLAIAAAAEPRLRGLFWAVSVGAALNMYMFYGLGEGWPSLVDRRWTFVDATVVAAMANVAIWLRGTGLFSTDRVFQVPGLRGARRR